MGDSLGCRRFGRDCRASRSVSGEDVEEDGPDDDGEKETTDRQGGAHTRRRLDRRSGCRRKRFLGQPGAALLAMTIVRRVERSAGRAGVSAGWFRCLAFGCFVGWRLVFEFELFVVPVAADGYDSVGG